MASDRTGVIRFEVFGPPRAVVDGRVVRWANSKVAQLATLLALEAPDLVPRALLAASVWPDVDAESARASLRNALTLLRRDLESASLAADDFLRSDRETLGWVSGAAVSSLAESRSAAESGDARGAAGAWIGPFLEGWDADWAKERRSTVRLWQAEVLERSGDETLALNCHLADPACEAKAAVTIRLLQAAGRGVEAVETFRRLERRLRAIGHGAPSQATVALAREARRAIQPEAELRPSNLPTARGPLFGRHEEVDAVQDLMEQGARVVTLVGPGGVGKTRLAIEVASIQSRPAWIVDLTSLVDPAGVPLRVLETVSESEQADDVWAGLRSRLAGRAVVLVLDNLEQFGPGLAGVVETLARTCPGAVLLGTSRGPIGASGERVVQVKPLALPDSVDQAMSSPSVALYVDRARAAVPGWSPTDDAALVELARRLEGLPLAIVLAASRADVFTERQVLQELEARFDVLATSDASVPERHRRLWACIDWSYRLVPEAQELLGRLAEFRSGWTLETAEASSGSPASSGIQTLLRSSLIHESARGETVRFDMAESVREFVRTRQAAADQLTVKDGHLRAMLAWLEHPTRSSQAFNAGYIRARSEEYENLRGAFEHALETDLEAALRIVHGLAYYWVSREMCREGSQWATRALDAGGDSSGVQRAMAWRALATMRTGLDDFQGAIEALDRALGLLPTEADPVLRARTLNSLGNALMRAGRFPEALEALQEGAEICEAAGQSATGLSMLGNSGFCHYLAGDLDAAERALTDVVGRLVGVGNDDWLSYFSHHLGLVAKARGDWKTAEERLTRAREVCIQSGGDPASRSWLTDAAFVSCQLGRFELAREQLLTSVRAVRSTKGGELQAECVEVAAVWCEQTDRPADALALLAYLDDASLRPQRSLADVSPDVKSRLERLKQVLPGEVVAAAAARYHGLTLVETLDEIEDLLALR